MACGSSGLAEHQRTLLEEWLPGVDVVKDHSWGLIGTTVLEVVHGNARLIVKAGDAHDHHLARELRAHRLWLEPWTSIRRAPLLLRGDEEAKLLVREFMDGELVQGLPAESEPDIYRQAGELLAGLHRQVGAEDARFEVEANEKALTWLDRPHRIAPETVAVIRAQVESWPADPVRVVPTHGDWQPRNWLVSDGVVSVIDFGRTELRPAVTDFARLAAQQFRANPRLEAAFIEGYGRDPRTSDEWNRVQLREAVGTAAWAYQVGAEDFEKQGHRMIAEALSP